MPLACVEPADPSLERERLLSQLWLDEYRACATDDGASDEVHADTYPRVCADSVAVVARPLFSTRALGDGARRAPQGVH